MVSQLSLKFEKPNSDRQNALFGREAAKFYQACLEEGVEPEEEHLFEVGELEIRLQNPSDIVNKSPRIKGFIKHAKRVSKIYGRETETKKGLLTKYFPEQFGKNGEQPIQDYNAGKVNRLFNNILDFYWNKYSQFR